MQSDQGLEFKSRAMKAYFASRGITQYSVKSQFKASLVERFNRTLKTKMWRYFTHKNTRKWVDVLPQLIDAYNNSRYRSIGMAPNQVNKENKMLVWRANEESDPAVPKKKKRIEV